MALWAFRMSASCAERLSPSRLRDTRGRRPGGRHGRPSRIGHRSGRRHRAASRAGQGSVHRSARAHPGRSGEGAKPADQCGQAATRSCCWCPSPASPTRVDSRRTVGQSVHVGGRVGSPAPPGGCPDEWLTPTAGRVADSRVGIKAPFRHDATPADGAVAIRQRPVAESGRRLLPNWAAACGPTRGWRRPSPRPTALATSVPPAVGQQTYCRIGARIAAQPLAMA